MKYKSISFVWPVVLFLVKRETDLKVFVSVTTKKEFLCRNALLKESRMFEMIGASWYLSVETNLFA